MWTVEARHTSSQSLLGSPKRHTCQEASIRRQRGAGRASRATQGTVCTILPTGSLRRSCPVLWHRRPPDGILEGHIFTDGSSSGSGVLRRAGWAVVAVDDVGNLKQAVPCDVLPGQSSRDGETTLVLWQAHVAYRLRRYHRDGQRAKVQSLGCRKAPSTRLEQATGSHDEVRAVKVKGHATQRDVEAGRTSHLFKRGNDCADTFAKKGADTQNSAFRVAKTVVACASLAKQAARWAAEAHVLLRFRGWDDTRAAAPRSRVRPPRARLRRKRDKETAAPATGQVSDWLSPIVRSRFSRGSHLDPRTFKGYSLQLGRVFDSVGRALDLAIIFCAKCGAVYWERADTLCRSCCGIPGGRTSQLRKLRSGLFPNKRYLGWTVEDVRGPSLDEATTLVAQLESCEAGLGRIVMGPTAHQKQRVAPQAARWNIGNTSPRWPSRGLGLAALGPGSAGFAGGVRARRSAGGKGRL